ncbi:MAG: ATP-binding cassette domain-containing protein, partial [Pseudomonadota bacterium]
SGQVLIDGTDIRDVSIETLRANIALVSQEISIFDDSIRSNIAYGKWSASQEEIEAAAKDAAAHEFIMALPEGYDTRVGEHGLKLSGGQRQRIAIARAMLRNAPILLLDEATSSLDADSERLVQAALERLQEGRTSLVIAHRLSTIIDSDVIYVVENGQIAEQGTHGELLGKPGIYQRLYGREAQNSTTESAETSLGLAQQGGQAAG